MSNKASDNLKLIGLIIGVATGVFSSIQAYALIPYRLNIVEENIRSNRIRTELDHDILIQVARDTQYIKERLDTIDARMLAVKKIP